MFPDQHLEPVTPPGRGSKDGLWAGTEDDPRLGSLVSFGSRPNPDSVLAIIGFPVDEGVRRNGGRVGSAEAPGSIREVFYRMTPDPRRADFSDLARRTVDLGDLKTTGTLSEMQQRLGEVAAALLETGVTPIILGGGHETSYGHFLGYAASSRRVSIVNFDAHVDVRPLVEEGGHSGSPFRQAIEHDSGACLSYRVAGVQPSWNARGHIEYVVGHGGRILWADEVASMHSLESLYIAGKPQEQIMVTIDMDVADGAFAPGVSAPATLGLTPDLLRSAAWLAGSTPSVGSIDVVEVNPAFDVDGRTVRLAATLLWTFISGFAARVT